MTVSARKKSPKIKDTFEKNIEPYVGGLPTGKRKWTRLSTRHIAARVGNISHQTIATWLRRLKFSLRSNVKKLASTSHPDRDRQFKLIRKARTRFLIEHINREIKVLKIMAERYRNRRKRHKLRMTLICAIRNYEIIKNKG